MKKKLLIIFVFSILSLSAFKAQANISVKYFANGIDVTSQIQQAPYQFSDCQYSFQNNRLTIKKTSNNLLYYLNIYEDIFPMSLSSEVYYDCPYYDEILRFSNSGDFEGINLSSFQKFFDFWSEYADLCPVGSVTFARVAPDLTIVSANANKSSVVAGENVQLSCQIKNIGNFSAAASKVYVYLSSTSNAKENKITDFTVSGLAANAIGTYSKSISIPGNTSAGNYYLVFEADGNTSIDESNENNNLKSTAISIKAALPDLAITKIELTSNYSLVNNSPSYRTNEYASGTIYYKNIGNVSAQPNEIYFFLSDSQEYEAYNWVQLGGPVGTSSISPGSELTASFSVLIPNEFSFNNNISSGYYYIHSKINRYNNTTELDSDNNHKTAKIYIYGGGSSKSMGISEKINDNNLLDNENDDLEIKVYPNPSTGKFKVDIPIKNIFSLEIFNEQGQLVYNKPIEDTGTYEVNLGRFNKGLYHIVLKENGKKYVKKIIIN